MASATPADASAPEKPRNIGPDGETIKDLRYYDLLEVRGDASDSDLKKAYRRQALKYHPDRNIGDDEAAEKFKEIGEAYKVLSDSNLRAAYNKHGIKQAGAQGDGGIEEATQMFSQMFGGERFHDWVGEIALAKEFTRAMDITMTDEEKAQLEKEAQAASGVSPSPYPAPGNISHEAHVEPAVTGQAAQPPTGVHATQQAQSGLSKLNLGSDTASSPAGSSAEPSASTVASGSGETTPKSAAGQKPGKLTPEQKKQLDALDVERQKEKEERVKMLVKKLIERVRPFVQATHPGEKGDPETEAFEKRIRLEADDLRLESFGVEMCKLIGGIYVVKATTFLKLHKKGPWSNVLGIPGFMSRMKEKGTQIKEGWSFLTSTLDVQNAMEDQAKRQEKGEIPEAEASELEKDLMGKILLVSWRGTRFEVAQVLRNVCDLVLSKYDFETGHVDKTLTETVLMNRAKAMLLIGAILSAVEADETDEERRELERLVASAAAKSKSKKKGKKGAEAAVPSSPQPPAQASTA